MRKSVPELVTTITPGRRCPICGKPATARHQPFCSSRCANIDLGRWLNGAYRAGSDEPADEEPPPEAGSQQ